MSRRVDFIRELLLAYLPWNTVWQHNVGAAYAWGEVVRQDFSRAAQWYRRAAKRGDAASQYDLGFMYLLGEGVDHDPIEGLRWLERAAEQGFHSAMRLLADVYRDGAYGARVDSERSERWRLAAEEAERDGAI
jgi:TPR repeat protein